MDDLDFAAGRNSVGQELGQDVTAAFVCADHWGQFEDKAKRVCVDEQARRAVEAAIG